MDLSGSNNIFRKTLMLHRGLHRTGRITSGFTLVELLVVIGIVAVLVAMVVPSLQQARAQMRTTACASNLRQQGVALVNYCLNERDTSYPYTARWSANWMVLIAPHLGYGLGGLTDTRGSAGSHAADQRVKGLRCPESAFYDNAGFPSESYYNGHYGINFFLTNSSSPLSRRKYQAFRADMSKIYLVSDHRIYTAYEPWTSMETGLSMNYVAPRGHKGRANILLTDGHVETLAKGQRKDLQWYDRRDDGLLESGWF